MTKLDFQSPTSWMLLPINWISEHFNCNNTFEILAYKFNVLGRFMGNPFYLQALKTWEQLINNKPQNIYELYSMPMWFNKYLNTLKSNQVIAKGFMYVKDLFPENNF